MNTMAGAFFLASENRSRTRLAPTPTNISTKSEPEMVKKGTPASPATARASRVLPVPGGPTSRMPVGIFAPTRVNFLGFFRNCTISCSSSFSSSAPATSLKVTLLCAGSVWRARDLPKPIMPPLPPPVCWRIRKNHSRPKSTKVMISGSHSDSQEGCAGSSVAKLKVYSVGLTLSPSTFS